MKVRIQVIIEDDGGHVLDSHDVFSFQRKHLQPEQVGLTLAEAKETLHGIQQTVVHHQIDDYLQEQHHCPHVDNNGSGKGSIRLSTVRCLAPSICPVLASIGVVANNTGRAVSVP